MRNANTPSGNNNMFRRAYEWTAIICLMVVMFVLLGDRVLHKVLFDSPVLADKIYAHNVQYLEQWL